MNFIIETDTRELRAAFHRAPIVVKTKLEGWIYKTSMRTERAAKQHIVPNVDTGQAQSSIHTRLGPLRAEVKPTAKHSLWIHQGRRPGGKLPPFGEGSALNSWARRKGINPFVVARSIARKGVKANPFMDKAYKEVRPAAERDGRDVLNEIVRGIK